MELMFDLLKRFSLEESLCDFYSPCDHSNLAFRKEVAEEIPIGMRNAEGLEGGKENIAVTGSLEEGEPTVVHFCHSGRTYSFFSFTHISVNGYKFWNGKKNTTKSQKNHSLSSQNDLVPTQTNEYTTHFYPLYFGTEVSRFSAGIRTSDASGNV